MWGKLPRSQASSKVYPCDFQNWAFSNSSGVIIESPLRIYFAYPFYYGRRHARLCFSLALGGSGKL